VRRRAGAPARRGGRLCLAWHAWAGTALGRLLAFGCEFLGHREHLAARGCARFSRCALDPGILRARTPEHDQLADRLDERGAQPLLERGGHGLAGVAVVAEHADLDQPVGEQRTVGFGHDGIGQAGIADHDDRIDVVGPGAQGAALGRRQLGGGGRIAAFCRGI
jgi:hypothetical protein